MAIQGHSRSYVRRNNDIYYGKRCGTQLTKAPLCRYVPMRVSLYGYQFQQDISAYSPALSSHSSFTKLLIITARLAAEMTLFSLSADYTILNSNHYVSVPFQ